MRAHKSSTHTPKKKKSKIHQRENVTPSSYIRATTHSTLRLPHGKSVGRGRATLPIYRSALGAPPPPSLAVPRAASPSPRASMSRRPARVGSLRPLAAGESTGPTAGEGFRESCV
ncbi:unnamed protein product, partial [Ectocarpus sp. 12 AP-2014]